MQNQGQFIVVEGLEGAGKTTAMQTIKRYLSEKGIQYISTREPGGTRVGEAVRELVKETSQTEPLDARSELLLLYASRVQLIELVIRPTIAKGTWVLADRFELSSWAYQGGGRQLSKSMMAELSSFCLNGLKPNLIVFLDIRPEQGLKRAKKRGKADRIEQESLIFFNNVYEAYHDAIKTMSNVVVIDASKPQPLVQDLIRSALNAHCHSVSFA